MDVEELGKLGRRKLVCPYYTARSAVPDAQLVLLPYSALLAQVRSDRLFCSIITHVVLDRESTAGRILAMLSRTTTTGHLQIWDHLRSQWTTVASVYD